MVELIIWIYNLLSRKLIEYLGGVFADAAIGELSAECEVFQMRVSDQGNR
jgi:hypothetical protein